MVYAITMLYLHGYSSAYSVYDSFKTDLCKAQAETDTDGDVYTTSRGWHLWNPTATNEASQKPLRAFNDEFANAQTASTSSLQIWHLGRALHFVQDMTNPYHAGGVEVDLNHKATNPHFLYELAATPLDPSPLFSPILYGSMSNGHNNGLRFFYEALNNGRQLFQYVDLDPAVSAIELTTAQIGIDVATQLTAGLMLYFFYNYYNAPSGGGGTGGLHPL